MSRNIRRKSLWLESNQGDTAHGKAFGFIGTHDTDDYQGWFFTWPGERAVITTVAERNAVIESLDADETCVCEEQIPLAWARQKLEKFLKSKFDLRRND